MDEASDRGFLLPFRLWAIDFGYTHPLVWQAWALEGDTGSLYRYAELYHSGASGKRSGRAHRGLDDKNWRALSRGHHLRPRRRGPRNSLCQARCGHDRRPEGLRGS